MNEKGIPMIDLAQYIRTIPDYPKPGILFRDITTLLGNGEAFAAAVDALAAPWTNGGVDLVAGIEARGFIIGGAVAYRLGLPFTPVRKRGKLPWRTIVEEYELEYGSDAVEMHVDGAARGHRVLLVDDLVATGGSAAAATRLIEQLQAEVIGISYLIDLPDLGGSARLRALGKKVHSLVAFEGD